MFRKVLMASVFLIVALSAHAEDSQRIASKVEKVTVFLNEAQVTRTAMVNISAGTSELIFGEISPGVDVQSIQVRANGEFTILSVNHEMDFLNEQVKQKHVQELQAQQKLIRDKILAQNSVLSVYREEEDMLLKNQVITGANANLDVLKLKQALDFQTERLTGLKAKQQIIDSQIAELNIELQKYDLQIADINKGGGTATSNILVTVSSKMALQSQFTLSYVVHNAGWYPTYDIRAKDVNSPLSISYKANVSQQSGEDWKNIKLTLSTGNPSISGSKPELIPYYLNFGMYYANQAAQFTSVTGTVTANDDRLPMPGVSVRIKGTTIGTQTNTAGRYSVQVPNAGQTLVFNFLGYEPQEIYASSSVINVAMNPSSQQLGEVVVTGALGVNRQAQVMGYSSTAMANKTTTESFNPIVVQTENQTNVEFKIDNPYTVPSDGKQYTVAINQTDLNASYEYAVAPKISTDVFLSAKITGWNKYNFLSGEANLFFEGTYIGKSLLNSNSTIDTLTISLGADKNIVVTRTSAKDLTEKQALGSNKKETRDWAIEIKNRKNQPVNLLVEDQVPVSQNSAIEVETQELSGGKVDTATGKVSWNLKLNAQDDKKLELKYQVKYPKNQTVIVQ